MLNNIRAVRDGLGLTSADTSVNWIPLYHDMGLIDAFLLPLLGGSPSVLIPTFDFMREPVLWLWAVHHYRGALSWSPNFAYTYCATRVPDTDLAGLAIRAESGLDELLVGPLDRFRFVLAEPARVRICIQLANPSSLMNYARGRHKFHVLRSLLLVCPKSLWEKNFCSWLGAMGESTPESVPSRWLHRRRQQASHHLRSLP